MALYNIGPCFSERGVPLQWAVRKSTNFTRCQPCGMFRLIASGLSGLYGLKPITRSLGANLVWF